MKILVFDDLMGDTKVAEKLLDLDLSSFDLLVYTGDMPNPSVFKELREHKVMQGISRNTDIKRELIEETTPIPALQKATDEIRAICKILERSPKPIYAVIH